MAKFKVRIVKPKTTEWFEVEGADIAEAVQDYHAKGTSFSFSDVPHVTLCVEGGERQHFTRFETEDGQTIVSRICVNGIWRKGGVEIMGSPKNLADIARLLEVDPDLLDGEWEGEESWDEAVRAVQNR